MSSDAELTGSSKLEFPEIQVVPTKSADGEADNKPTHTFGRRPQMVGDAKKRFSKMAMKVITQIVTEEERPESSLPPQPSDDKLAERRKSRAKKGAYTPRSGAASPTPSSGKQSLPDLLSASVPSHGGRGQVNQFASLVRLARFRRMTNAFGKDSGASSRRTSVIDIEEDGELPDIPRFCATLSPEAQYATMKGYEDVLLDKIKRVRSECNNLLYRVKTPHQTVLALHIAEPKVAAEEGRSHYTVSRPPSSLDGSDSLLAQSFSNLHQRAPPGHPYGHALPNIGGDKRRALLESQVKRITVPKERQRKISIKFQRAMDILDTLKVEQGITVQSTSRVQKVTNPVAYYNSWSQAWAREFQFEYSPKP